MTKTASEFFCLQKSDLALQSRHQLPIEKTFRQKNLLQHPRTSKNENRIQLVLSFNRKALNVSKIMEKYWPILHRNETIQKAFTNTPIVSFNPSRPNPGRREKIKLIFYFHTFLWRLTRFQYYYLTLPVPIPEEKKLSKIFIFTFQL